MTMDPEILHPELTFQTSRSGGSGGQHVNKVETKVELRFDIINSQVLTEEQKETLYQKLRSRMTNERVLVLYHQTERSQLGNKEKVILKFNELINQAFVVVKKRKPTRPTLVSKLKRLQGKQRHATVKSLRKRPLEE
jgi:ribosome-associated protein